MRTPPAFLPHEAELAEAAADSRFLAEMPEKRAGGTACGSGKLDENLLEKHGVGMTAPRRSSRKKPETQEERELQAADCPI